MNEKRKTWRSENNKKMRNLMNFPETGGENEKTLETSTSTQPDCIKRKRIPAGVGHNLENNQSKLTEYFQIFPSKTK